MSSSSSSSTVDSMNKRKYDTVKEISTTANSMNKRKRDTMEEKNEKQQIFAPCDIKFMQKKSSETSALPDPLLTSVIFATHDEINAMEDLTDQYIVLTGKMAEMFDGKISKSSENKTEAKRLTKLLGGKWSSSISGKYKHIKLVVLTINLNNMRRKKGKHFIYYQVLQKVLMFQ